MASSAAIRVYVLEGQYAQLSTLGFPVSLVMELQQGGLRLDNAKWSSRRSDAGFSVSFFWPAALSPRRRRRRQRRRKPRAQPDLKRPNSNCNNYDRPSAATFPARLPTSVLPIPSDAHHPPAPSSVANTQVALLPPIQSQTNYTDPSTSDSISKASASSKSPGSQQLHHVSSEASQASLEHLDDADSIEFEIREDEPVVKHTTRGKVGWTPIRVRNNLSTTGVQGEDYYDVEYLKKCK